MNTLPQTTQQPDILSLHVAEYEQLMTRNTYVIACQFSLAPLVLILLGLVVQGWLQSNRTIRGSILLWVGINLGLFISMIWADALWDMYNNIRYIQRELKIRVATVVGTAEFWDYETYQARLRGRSLLPWEWVVPAIGVVLLTALLILVWPHGYWEYLLSGLSIVLFARLIIRAYGAVKIRREFSRVMK